MKQIWQQFNDPERGVSIHPEGISMVQNIDFILWSLVIDPGRRIGPSNRRISTGRFTTARISYTEQNMIQLGSPSTKQSQ
jgi:hypothetical protein